VIYGTVILINILISLMAFKFERVFKESRSMLYKSYVHLFIKGNLRGDYQYYQLVSILIEWLVIPY